MSNKDLLTDAEFASYRPHPMMVDHIERCRSGFGVARQQFRILDWGCGRGTFVLWLRERDYDAVGVDIDPEPFANGAARFRTRGYAIEECLHALDPHGTAPFADSSFHCVTSYQTLEHVRDLERVAAEWSRLTVDGGCGFHIYPPYRRLVEPHLFMPLVHWLPKTAVRRWLIGLFVLLKVEPRWWPNTSVSWKEKVRTYYEFSVRETFYRTPAAVRSPVEASGFHTQFVDVEAGHPSRRLVRKWLGSSRSSRLVRTWFMNYGANVGLAACLHKPVRGRTRRSSLVG